MCRAHQVDICGQWKSFVGTKACLFEQKFQTKFVLLLYVLFLLVGLVGNLHLVIL